MNHSKKTLNLNEQYKFLVTIKEADLIVEADSEKLLGLLVIDLPKLKITNSVEQRSHYRAISNWLTKFKTSSNASNLDRVKGYLNAFDHLCELKEWDKAVAVIAAHLDSPLKETLFEELQGWGEYGIVISICNQLLGRVSEDFDCYLYNQMGIAYQRIGLYREAIDFFQKLLDISSKFEDILIQGDALGHIGDTYRLIGEIDKATNYIEKSWEILEHSDKRGLKQSAYFSSLGNISLDREDYNQAIQLHKQSLSICKKLDNKQGYLTSLVNLAAIHLSLKQNKKTVKYIKEGLEIAKSIGNRKLEAKLLSNLGMYHSSLKEQSQGLECFENAQKLFKEINDKEGEGETIAGLGLLYYNSSNYRQAITYLEQSLSIMQSIEAGLHKKRVLDALGKSYLALEEYDMAIQHLQTSLDIRKEKCIETDDILIFIALGTSYFELKNYSQAINYYEQYLALNEMLNRYEDLEDTLNYLGSAYSVLGSSHSALGENYKATEYHKKSIDIASKVGDQKEEAVVLNNLATNLLTLKEYDQAIECLQQCLKITRAINDRKVEAGALGNLANIYRALGDHSRTIKYNHQCLEIAHEVGDFNCVSRTLGNLGNAYFSLRNYEQAVYWYQKRIIVAEKIGDFPGIKKTQEILAKLKFNSKISVETTHVDFPIKDKNLILIVDRRDIEEFAIYSIVELFNQLQVTRETIFESRGKIDFVIHGYDDDPRELFEITEVRRWISLVESQVKYWSFFLCLDRESQGINLLYSCTTTCKKVSPTQMYIPVEETFEFWTRHIAWLNEFCDKHQIDENTNTEITNLLTNKLFPGLKES